MRAVEENGSNKVKKPQQATEEDEIKKLLLNHRIDNPCLDLCGRNLTSLPSELFVLAHVQVCARTASHCSFRTKKATVIPKTGRFDGIDSAVIISSVSKAVQS